MKSSDFHFSLPEQLIAKYPLENRNDSRLLLYQRSNGTVSHTQFDAIESFLTPGDLLIFNDTRVMQARLYGQKTTGGKVELLVERILAPTMFAGFIKASKAPKPGTQLILEHGVRLEVIRREGDIFICRLLNALNVESLLRQQGQMPLPPYIDRQVDDADSVRYQTVYAKQLGAVAAPTAGLHFNQALMERLKEKGINQQYLTLHVGAGTFQPVRVENINEHVMHSEWVNVSDTLIHEINKTKAAGNRVIAVGTTVVRSLETAALSGELKSFEGETDIFIYPGFEFKVIDAMLTNFHLPESTLLMLVSAFIGKQNALALYQEAIDKAYRFFSYGDTSLLL